MGYKKFVDSVADSLFDLVYYGVWILIFGVIALIAYLFFWSTIKIILIGIGLFIVTILILVLYGVKLF